MLDHIQRLLTGRFQHSLVSYPVASDNEIYSVNRLCDLPPNRTVSPIFSLHSVSLLCNSHIELCFSAIMTKENYNNLIVLNLLASLDVLK